MIIHTDAFTIALESSTAGFNSELLIKSSTYFLNSRIALQKQNKKVNFELKCVIAYIPITNLVIYNTDAELSEMLEIATSLS